LGLASFVQLRSCRIEAVRNVEAAVVDVTVL